MIDSTYSQYSDKNNAWVVCELFKQLVNITAHIKQKARNVYLSEKEMIVKSKQGFYLVNWGAKKIFQDEELVKHTISNSKSAYESLLETYGISIAENED